MSVKDIGTYCAKALLAPVESSKAQPTVVRIFGPRFYTPIDVKNAIEEATGGKKGTLEVVHPEALHEFWVSEGIPPEYAPEFVELSTSQLAGGIIAENGEYEYREHDTVRGETELVDVLREIVSQL